MPYVTGRGQTLGLGVLRGKPCPGTVVAISTDDFWNAMLPWPKKDKRPNNAQQESISIENFFLVDQMSISSWVLIVNPFLRSYPFLIAPPNRSRGARTMSIFPLSQKREELHLLTIIREDCEKPKSTWSCVVDHRWCWKGLRKLSER
jgi:hypothetical protein